MDVETAKEELRKAVRTAVRDFAATYDLDIETNRAEGTITVRVDRGAYSYGEARLVVKVEEE